VGVGHEPQAIALMRCADIGSSQHCPPAVIPERGKVGEDSHESPSNEGWAVLHEHVARSNLAHDARHVAPQAGAFAINACALAGDRDVLAGKPARYDVNNASPSACVKGAHVIPYRERRKKAVELAGHQYACGIGIAFDGADDAPAEQFAGQDAASSARKEREFAQAITRVALKSQVIH